MYSLVYVSSATTRPSREELVALLTQCHHHNSRKDITGLLLYNGLGTFIQALEGSEEAVKSLYEKIRLDPRHRRVTKISGSTVTERDFPSWRMGFRNMGELADHKLEGFSAFMQMDSEKTGQFYEQNKGVAADMLTYFKSASEELVF